MTKPKPRNRTQGRTTRRERTDWDPEEDGLGGASIVIDDHGRAGFVPVAVQRLDPAQRACADELGSLGALRQRVEAEIVGLVGEARSSGISWGVIGLMLGTSSQAARQRYGGVE